MSSPNDPSDPRPQTPPNGGFASPGGAAGSPPYGGQQYGGQPNSGQQYGRQPQYGNQPPYGAAPSGQGGTPGPNRFGLAALIIGCVSIVLAFIPVINYVSGILALVGLVLGIVGLVIKNRKRGLAIGGIISSAIGLILSIVLAVVYTVGFAGAIVGGISEQIPDSTSIPSFPSDAGTTDPDARTVDVVYEVTGAGTDATIVYLSVTAEDAGSDIETLTAQTLPWTEEFDATVGGDFDYTTFNVTATNGAANEGEISCSITVDGEVVAEDTAEGASAIVSCLSSDLVG